MGEGDTVHTPCHSTLINVMFEIATFIPLHAPGYWISCVCVCAFIVGYPSPHMQMSECAKLLLQEL